MTDGVTEGTVGRRRPRQVAEQGRATRWPSRPPTSDQGAIDKVVEKVDAKAEKLDRVAAKVDAEGRQARPGRDEGGREGRGARAHRRGLGALDLWTRAEPAPRRPRFTRDEITAAAVRIADTEGFDALSMRRLAVELDAGTMTLYHYVRTKDELLTLVVDAVMGEVVLGPDEPLPDALARRADDARRATRAVARCATRGSSTSPTIPAIGPNSVRHFDQSLAGGGVARRSTSPTSSTS